MVKRGFFRVIDNSGAKVVRFIGTVGNSRVGKVRVGDVIVIAVKEADPSSVKVDRKSKHKCVFRALVVATRLSTNNDEFGHRTRFNYNSVILLTYDIKKRLIPLGNKVLGWIDRRAMEFCNVAINREAVNKVLSTAERCV